jgi:hypothetical protein
MKKVILGLTIPAVAGASVQSARAGDKEWAAVGKVLTGIAVAAVISHAVQPAPPCYVAPPVPCPAPVVTYGYGPPPPVVYVQPAPPPVVVYRAPVYVAPAPVCVVPARVRVVRAPVVNVRVDFEAHFHHYQRGCW